MKTFSKKIGKLYLFLQILLFTALFSIRLDAKHPNLETNSFINLNQTPTVSIPLVDQEATENIVFSFVFPENTFDDLDGDGLTYTALLAGGETLPEWLSFDPSTRTFIGTPLAANVGTLSVEVTADDGNEGTVSDVFDIVIAAANNFPTLANPLLDQEATENTEFSFVFPENTFADLDGDGFTYSALLAGGETLPEWLSFDPLTRTFNGTPLAANVGTITVEVTADDGNEGTVSDVFDIVIAAANNFPTLANPLLDQEATENTEFSFVFPENTFADLDGDGFTYSALLAGGGTLPEWLSFDALTRTLSGTPLAANVGTISVEVTADDGKGGTVSDSFDIVVVAANNFPTVANPLLDQEATENTEFSFVFPENTFADLDGDGFTYSALLAGGGTLPEWLSFDALNRTLSGTPLAANVGTITVEVTADDGNEGTVSDVFDIVIAAANNFPTLANPLLDQEATENTEFSFVFPENTFADLDGDGFTYSALLAGGETLPEWLSFDALTRTLSGTPLAANVGTISVEVTADDGKGGTVSDSFDIVVVAANNFPTLANPLLDQEATENTEFSFVLPENTFADLDGDGFTYSALLAGGGTLPEWLSFDALTRTFSGTPLAANVGTISVEVTANDGKGGTVSDTFDIVVAAQPIIKSLIHYWNFNDELNLLQPTISLAIGARIAPQLLGNTVLTFGTGQSFAGLNARNGDLAEEHLRFNLPIGSNLVFSIPTTGYRGIIVKYETRRSGSGAGLQTLSYTLDGTNFIFLQDVLPVDGAPQVITLDFTSIDGVSDNPNFKIKVEFSQGTGGVEGNNRFDNITVEGEAFEGQNFAPITIGNIPFRQITKGQGFSVDLSTIFSDPNGDALEYNISSLDTDLVNAILTGNSLEISTLKAGSATINITASDGSLTSPILSFRTLIYPEPHVLSTGSYSFANWSAQEPDGSFPPSMIFLQSGQDDPSLDTELLFDYTIPPSDYAAADIANIGFPYKNTSRTRINGLGENGISFINTGRGRDLGGALLALDSRNVDGVKISFDAETLIPNFRQYNFSVLYRVGIESPWQVVNNVNGVPLVYVGKDVVEGSLENLTGYLPANGLGHEYVQVLVKYHYVGPVTSGARRMLRLDNLEITNESDPTVGTAPGNTTLLSPENNSSLVSVLPMLTWSPATDAGNYQLEVATENGFENPEVSQQILSGTEFTLTTPLAFSQVYFWRVKAVNGFGESEWSPIFTFTTEAEPAPILIAVNEIMASNVSTIQDEDGTFSDWIELYNYGSETYNLEGFGLSDSDGSPFKWVFPAVNLAPGQYLLVWASSKNRTNPSNPLHTTFAISSNGEPILLTSPDGVLVNRIDPLASTADISRGRFPNGSETIELFTQPTPGAANISDGVGPVLPLTAPEFSVPPGFYQANIELNLTHPDPQAVIRYTLDGSEPTESSPVWSGTQTITDRSSEPNVISLIPTNFITGARGWTPPSETIKKATVIRAKAFKTGGSESPIKTATYFVLPGHNYSLPVVSVVTNPANLFDENIGLFVPGASYVSGDDDTGNYYQSGDLWERPASMEMYGQGFNFQQNIAIRINGNYTRRLPQKSLRIYAKGEPGKSSIDYPIFQNPERSGFQRMILRNFGNDWGATLMTDVLSQTMAKHMNVDYQHFRTSVVFINGEYWGLHNFRERYDKYYFERIYGVDPDNIDYLENQYIVSEGDANNYMEFIKFFESNDLSADENYAEMNRRMDIDNFIDYYVTEIFVNNNDWPQNNLEYWRARVPYNPNAPKGQDGRWRWIIKDLDRSFGRIISSNFNMLEWATNGSSGWATSLFRNLLKNEEFKYAFINRMSDQLNTGFKKERILHLVDSIQTIMQPEVPEHTKRWNQPSSFADWINRIQNVKSFINLREGFVRQHFIDYFGLGGTANIILDISDQGAGSIRINSLEINEQTLGLSQGQVYPWNGTYFKDIPISLQAIANPGYSFSHWVVNDLVVKSQNAKIVPTQNTAIKAVFVSSNRFFSELVSPVNESFGAGPNPNFEWNNAPEAVSHRIQVSIDPGMSQLVLDQANLTTNNYVASNLDLNQVYYWWIISTNAEGVQDWSEIWRFSPAEEGTLTTPVLLSPGNDNQNTPLKVQLVWNEVFGADSYQLQVSVDPTFSSTFLETTVQSGNSYPLSGLLENTVYYWRVRANRGTNSSDWSLVRNLKTLDLLDLNEGLVGHWKLDEGSGNTLIDHSGNGYNAIIQNTTGITWSPGVIDLGINLNGSWGRYALVPHQPNLELPNALSISTWVKPNTLGRHTIISKADGNGFELWLDISGKIEFRLNRGNNGTAYRILSNFNYSSELGKWIHLAATFDGRIMKIFVNGNLDAITSFPQFGIGTSSGDLVIGALGTIQRLNGSLDDLRLYNRSLSDSDINALFIGEPALPGVPNLTSPSSGTEFPLGQEVELKWSASPQAERYQIQLAFDEDFIDLVTELDLNNALSYQTTGLLAETTYFWRVRAFNSEGSSEWSSVRNFKTGGSILPVTGISIDPTSANIQVGNTLQLTATVFPSNASNQTVTWTTSNPLTASVSSSGLVTGLSVGTAIVSATTEDGNFKSESLFTVTGNNSNLGLVGYWKMDEGSGNTLIDHSGNGNNALLQNTSGVSWSAGIVDQAINLPGTLNRFAIAPHSQSLNITEAITISAWVKPNSVHIRRILSKTGPNGYEFGTSSLGKLEFRLTTSSGTSYLIRSNSNYPADGNTWIHMVATFDGSTSRIYINGALDASASFAPALIGSNTSGLYIGSLNGNNRWNGAIDDLRLYGRALSGAEVLALYSGDGSVPQVPAVPSLISPLDGQTGVQTSPLFSWSQEQGALTYQLQVAENNLFNNPVVDISGITETSSSVSGLDNNTLHYWRVRATNLAGNSEWSLPRSFTTETIVIPPISQNLVGYWKMDEGSGNTLIDHSGNGNNALLQNTSGVSWSAGKVDQAINLPGTLNRFAIAPHSQSLNITETITISAWVKPNSVHIRRVLSKTGPNGYEFGTSNLGKLEFRLTTSSGSTYLLRSNSDYPSDGNTWIHIAATFDGTTSRIYINGALDASASFAPALIGSNTSGLYIGSLNGNNRWQGAIDDLRLYGRALSAIEILNLANSGGALRTNENPILKQGSASSTENSSVFDKDTQEKNRPGVTRMFPNPVLDLINLELSNSQEERVQVSIFDMKGILLLDREFESENGTLVLDISKLGLKPGTHVLLVNTNGTQQVFKFLKK